MKEPTPPGRATRALFDRASDRLDPSLAGRLRAARRTALTRRASPFSRNWLPIAVAAVLVLSLAWWLPRRAPERTVPTDSSADLTLIESDEDSEVYSWLSDAPVARDDEKGDAL
jgi:hypothetical protein